MINDGELGSFVVSKGVLKSKSLTSQYVPCFLKLCFQLLKRVWEKRRMKNEELNCESSFSYIDASGEG
jgi:hypothetical protein